MLPAFVTKRLASKSWHSHSLPKATLTSLTAKQPPPPRKPLANTPIKLHWRKSYAAKALLAVDEGALVVAEIAEFVRFDYVFLDRPKEDPSPQ